ncbi:MAG: hypothetical protein C4297_08205 [Gemmataceae bacterium]
MRWLGRGVLCLGIGTVLVLGGCSSTKEGTVRGKVTYQGKPLEYGTVLFHFENGHVVGAMIGPDGTYVAQRLPTGLARLAVYAHPPVPEGFYLRNEVLPPSRDAPQLATLYAQEREPRTVSLPVRYARPEASGLSLTIGPGEQQFDIELRP